MYHPDQISLKIQIAAKSDALILSRSLLKLNNSPHYIQFCTLKNGKISDFKYIIWLSCVWILKLSVIQQNN
jgi:hypothetical protein